MPRTVRRLVASRYQDRAFDGEGARRWGGRWNHPGTPMVYTSASLSLAAVELFVNVEADLAPDALAAVSAEIPETLPTERWSASQLPSDWRDHPAPDDLKDLGTDWVLARRSVVLAVPSVVIPQEENFLLNPMHPDFPQVRFGDPEAFSFDPRMWKEKKP